MNIDDAKKMRGAQGAGRGVRYVIELFQCSLISRNHCRACVMNARAARAVFAVALFTIWMPLSLRLAACARAALCAHLHAALSD